MEPHFALSRERATEDLDDERAAEAAVKADQQTEAVRAEQDALRSQQTPEQQQQPPAEQETAEQQQQQQQYAQEGIDPEITEALQKNPKLVAAIHQQQQETAAAVQKYQAEAAQYVQAEVNKMQAGLHQNAELAAATVLSQPEFAGLKPEHLAGAYAALKQSNPARFAEISRQINNAHMLANHFQTVAQAQAQQAQEQRAQQHSQWTKVQDDIFDKIASQRYSPAQLERATKDALPTLREYGFSDAEVTELYRNGPLRDVRAQILLADLVLGRATRQGLKNALANPVPQVQRPGFSERRVRGESDELANAERRFSGTRSAKDAAAVLSARRAARR
jgi:membrane protein involved in colicin uptake